MFFSKVTTKAVGGVWEVAVFSTFFFHLKYRMLVLQKPFFEVLKGNIYRQMQDRPKAVQRPFRCKIHQRP